MSHLNFNEIMNNIKDAQWKTIIEPNMITAELLYDFLRSSSTISKHSNQLESIDKDSFTYQILTKETLTLITNFIVSDKNAHELMAHNSYFPFMFIPAKQFCFVKGSINDVFGVVSNFFVSEIKSDDFIVLTSAVECLDKLNKNIQKIYNHSSKYVTDRKGNAWVIGDRVVFTKNNYEYKICNGQIGYIEDLTNEILLVDFGKSGLLEFSINSIIENDSISNFNESELLGLSINSITENDLIVDNLSLNYSATITKSQGNMWPYTILYVPDADSLNNKNLITAAITCSKFRCFIVY